MLFKLAIAALVLVLLQLSSTPVLGTRKLPVLKPKFKNWYVPALSIDGGAFRGVVPAVVLETVSDVIKEVMVERNYTNGLKANEFEIVIQDYFKVFAGASVGCLMAAYYAERGGNAPKVEQLLGIVGVPGSAKAMTSWFTAIAAAANASQPTFPPTPTPQPSESEIIKAATEASAAVKLFGATLFGDKTLNDMRTSLYCTVTDIARNRGVTVFRSDLRKSSGYVIGDDLAQHVYGANFVLQDLTRASAAYVPGYLPANLRTTPDTRADKAFEAIVIDGGFTALTPMLQMLEELIEDVDSPNKIAILGLGCGEGQYNFDTVLDWTKAIIENPGLASFLPFSSAGKLNVNSARELLARQLGPKGKKRVLYIQPKAFQINDADPKYIAALRSIDPLLYDTFVQIAQETADAYRVKIKEFVKQYIVPKNS